MKIQLIHLDDNPLTLSALKTSFLNYKHPAFDIIVDSFSLPDEFTFFINTLPDVNIFLLDIDLNHKHVDGTNIAEQCRAQFPNSVILMMSAFDNNFNIEKSRQCGADDFLTKNIIDTALPDLIISTYERIIFSRGQSETSHTFPKPYSELPKFAGTTIKAITLKIAMAIRSIP